MADDLDIVEVSDERLRMFMGWHRWERNLLEEEREQLALSRFGAFGMREDVPLYIIDGLERMKGGCYDAYSNSYVGYDLALELAECETPRQKAIVFFDWEITVY